MGWTIDGVEGHEGYVEAVERRYDCRDEWRDINFNDDEWRARAAKGIQVQWVQVVCECGWRSERFLAPLGTHWSPCIVMFPGWGGDDSFYDNACWDLWYAEHGSKVTADPGRTLTSVAAEYRRKSPC